MEVPSRSPFTMPVHDGPPVDRVPRTEPRDAAEAGPARSEGDSPLSSRDASSEDVWESEETPAEKPRGPEDEAAQRTAQRTAQRQLLAVEELVQSERNYLQMLQVCSGTIRRNLTQIQPPPAHLDSLFLHTEDVMDVSRRLLGLLERTRLEPGDPLYLQALCRAFLSLSADMEAAYREYLAAYGAVPALESSYKQEEELWAQMVAVIKAAAPEVNATSLSFFLVMPVQRMARYPLLLRTVQKLTPASHPASGLLERAALAAVALNGRINEYKRFRDVADKYKKTEQLSIKDKINRISTHSIAKKTARMSQQLKHEAGIRPKLVDEEFDALEGFFRVLEHGILQLLDNVQLFLLHLQRFLACGTEEFDLELDGEKEPVCFKEISTALRQWVLPALEERTRTLVLGPLLLLRDLLRGPRNLIRKRLDKLLDYEPIVEKAGLSYEEQAVASTYRTINALLVNELPRFNAGALQMIWGLLGTFSCLHRDLAADMEQLFHSFAQQLSHSSLSAAAFWQWAGSAVVDGASRLDAVCLRLQDTLSAPVAQPLSPSSQRRLRQLTDKHGSAKIYQVTAGVVAGRDLDLHLAKGELVAVLGEADTRGDRRRWLVDAGGRRGYAPSSKLTRYHQPAEEPPPSPHLNLPGELAGVRRHSYTPEVRPLTLAAKPCFQVFAAYDFTARGNHEVSVGAGEPVRVLEPHDKRGNPEWSLVEAGGGHRGYVPSNYLTMAPVTTAPQGPRGSC